MSDDDLLLRAAHALRASSTPATHAAASRTRANVLLASKARTKRRKVVSLVLPIAAVIALSTAWAGTHGASSRWRSFGRYFGAESETASTAIAPGNATQARRPAASTATPASPVATNAIAAADVAPDLALKSAVSAEFSHKTADARRAARPHESSIASSTGSPAKSLASSSPVASASAAMPDDDVRITSLYAAAHRAHFVDRDPGAALVAWDAYLAAAPDGALAPEARYNRALALVRLGRRDEARRALAPFAGDPRGYRARDASSLLQALDTE